MLYLFGIIVVGYLMYICYEWFFKHNEVFNSDLTETQKELLEKNVLYYTKLSAEEKLRFSIPIGSKAITDGHLRDKCHLIGSEYGMIAMNAVIGKK